MKIEKTYKSYKNLLFAVLCFLSGIYTLTNEQYKSLYGWFILGISFLFLSTFWGQKKLNVFQRKLLVSTSYIIAIGLIILGLYKLLIT
nr:hypothetical protein [uncultured Draconibacterium sp.]